MRELAHAIGLGLALACTAIGASTVVAYFLGYGLTR